MATCVPVELPIASPASARPKPDFTLSRFLRSLFFSPASIWRCFVVTVPTIDNQFSIRSRLNRQLRSSETSDAIMDGSPPRSVCVIPNIAYHPRRRKRLPSRTFACHARDCLNVVVPIPDSIQTQAQLQSQGKTLIHDSWCGSTSASSSSPLVPITLIPERAPLLPVICYAVGGSWVKGDRSQPNAIDVLRTLCSRGSYVGVSMGYRVCRTYAKHWDGILAIFATISTVLFLGSQDGSAVQWCWLVLTLLCWVVLVLGQLYQHVRHHSYPIPVHDLADAIRWITSNISSLGGDPSRLILIGHSAGAHLLTLLYSDLELWSRTECPRASVRALVPISGLYSAAMMRSYALYGSLANYIFGHDRDQAWDRVFPLEQCIAQPLLHWAPTLFLNAQWDIGLGAGTGALVTALSQRGDTVHWTTFHGVDHFSIVNSWSSCHAAIASLVLLFLSTCE